MREDNVKKKIKGRIRILSDIDYDTCIHGIDVEIPCSDCEYETYEDDPEEFEE